MSTKPRLGKVLCRVGTFAECRLSSSPGYIFAECQASPSCGFAGWSLRRVPDHHFAESVILPSASRLGKRHTKWSPGSYFTECYTRQSSASRRRIIPGDHLAPGSPLRRVPGSAKLSSPSAALGKMSVISRFSGFFRIHAFQNIIYAYIFRYDLLQH